MPLPLTKNVFNVLLLSILKEKVARRMRHVNKVGENIIGAPKIRDNYGAISAFLFSNIAIAIFDFFLLILVKSSLLIFFASLFAITFLLLSFISLSIVIALPTIGMAKVVALSRSLRQ